MASSPKLMSILFLFALFSLQQIHAREFFSKIPRVNNNEKEQQQETLVPYRSEEQSSVGKQEQEQEKEPRFIPESETENGYGLYGHESESSTNTKETYKPYVTPVRYHPDEPYNSIPESNYNNNKKINSYETDLGTEARFTEKGWSTTQENKNSYNGEKKGMSDTRYMENGRYYYDVNNENNINYYPNQYQYNDNNSGTRGGSVANSRNHYYNQNQEEFQENQEEDFEP